MNLFDFVKSQVSILSVVQEYCNLKKAGSYWKGPCPFHTEKTASFTVSPHKEIFYCFGCHQGGDVIAFVALIERCSQSDAAHSIIDRHHLSVPESLLNHAGPLQADKQRHEQLCEHLATWMHQALLKNSAALNYFKKRGFTITTLEQWKLGFLPAQHLNTLTHYLLKKGFLVEEIVQTHIMIQGKQGLYSPFEERIIFPIQDALGRVCAFGGRIFQPNDQRAKYYNSPEHPYFNKGSLVFGLAHAKQKIKELQEIILVEGYMDCIALHQAGFSNAVATLGTACTNEHLNLLERHASEVCILYDSDKAGKQALLRLAQQCWNNKLELSVVNLPEQEDPASFLLKGSDLQPLINQKQDILYFYLEYLSQGFFKKSTQEKLQLIEECLTTIGHVKDDIKKNLLLQKISLLFMIPIQQLENRLLKKNMASPKLPDEQPQQDLSLEKILFSVILKSKIILSSEDEQFFESHLSTAYRQLYIAMKQYRQESGVFDTQRFITNGDSEQRARLAELIMMGEYDTQESYEFIFGQFQKKQWKLMVNDVKMELAQPAHKQDPLAIQQKLKELQNLQKKLLQRGLI